MEELVDEAAREDPLPGDRPLGPRPPPDEDTTPLSIDRAQEEAAEDEFFRSIIDGADPDDVVDADFEVVDDDSDD